MFGETPKRTISAMNTHSPHKSRGAGARGRRPVLIALTALGAALGLLGMAGVFAVASDRGTTGTNSYETAGFDEVDVQLATYDAGTQSCGSFTDDLQSPVMSAVDDGSFSAHAASFCLRNAGQRPAALTVSAIDILDVDFDCTAFEAELDSTCGSDAAGELAAHALFIFQDCEQSDLSAATLDDYAMQPHSLGTLDPNVYRCLTVRTSGETFDDGTRRVTQSDRVSWRFAFDGTLSDGSTEPPPAECTDDSYEPNSAESPAPYSGTVEGTVCPNDEDWFSYDHAGGALAATLSFSHAAGDLDLDLYDATGETRIAMSDSVTDEESVGADLPAGTYLIRIYGYQGQGNPSYVLNVASS